MGQIKNEWLAKRRRDINFSVHSFPVLIILPHSVYRNFESLSMFVVVSGSFLNYDDKMRSVGWKCQ